VADPGTFRADRRSWLIVAACLGGIAGAVAWRVPRLWDTPLWIDEAFTWRDIQQPVRVMIGWNHHTTHPPLSYLLVKIFTRVTGGEAEWQLRAVSFAGWMLAIVAAFFVGRRLHSRAAGLCLALFIAMDPVMANQGVEARMHMLSLMFTLASLTWAGRLLERREARVWPWLALAVLLGAVFWSSAAGLYLAPAILGGAAICVWRQRAEARVAPGRPSEPARVGQSIALTALFWAALCHVGLLKLVLHHRPAPVGEQLTHTLADALRLVARFPGMVAHVPYLGGLIVAAGVTGLIVVARRGGQTARLALVVLAVNVVAISTLATVHHGIYPRYFLPASAMVWLGVAALGVEAWRRNRAVAAVMLTACVALVAWSAVTWRPLRDNVGGRLTQIRAVAEPDEVVVVYPDWLFHLSDYYLGDTPTMRARAFEPYEDAAALPDELPAGLWLVAGFVGEDMDHSMGPRWRAEYEALTAKLARRYGYVYRIGEANVRSRVTLFSRYEAQPDRLTRDGPVPAAHGR